MPYNCKIKLCGLKSVADVRVAVELGVDAVGFVLSSSPRCVSLEMCGKLRAEVADGIRVHGVFAAEDVEFIAKAVTECGLDVAQVHGREGDAAYWTDLSRELGAGRCIRGIRVESRKSLDYLEAVRGQEFLLDAYVKGKAGGTGMTFDWALAKKAGDYGRVILAGGLSPENVAEAIRIAMPYMVDVSSGIEAKRGVKDHDRMRAFVRVVRQTVCGLSAIDADGK